MVHVPTVTFGRVGWRRWPPDDPDVQTDNALVIKTSSSKIVRVNFTMNKHEQLCELLNPQVSPGTRWLTSYTV